MWRRILSGATRVVSLFLYTEVELTKLNIHERIGILDNRALQS